MNRVTLIDSPVSNAANISRALRAAGAELRVTARPEEIAQASKLVLPGVGSFRAAMEWLTSNRIDDAIRTAVARGVPLLGICVGHQVLFDRSEEMGVTPGLGLLRGVVSRLSSFLPVPQIGWNRVNTRTGRLFEGIPNRTPFYFVNSYVVASSRDSVGEAGYGSPFTAAVEAGNVFGVQFHPEKSSTAGLRVLQNFANL